MKEKKRLTTRLQKLGAKLTQIKKAVTKHQDKLKKLVGKTIKKRC